MTRLETDHQSVADWLANVYIERLRQPKGILAHPFVDPGAGYEDLLWDWDAYFFCLGLSALAGADSRIGRHARGSVDNLLERQGPDGSIPYAVFADGTARPPTVRDPDSPKNSCKPLMAQFALLATRLGGGDNGWLDAVRLKLAAHIEHWFATQLSGFDLLTWRSHRGSGADNHPAYFQRPQNTVADPFLNSLMVTECRAMAEICSRTGADPSPWAAKAEALAEAIEKWLWDPIDQTYYAIDVAKGDPGRVRTPADWAVPLKFRSWVMVMPLWAGVASPSRARAVVERHLVPTDQLGCAYGLRSLAKVEPAYRIFADSNPSDWCGPVWVVATYLGFRAMMRYGFNQQAEALATGHLRLLASDYEQHGVLHEYYEPDTGEGLTHPGFVNWNSCAVLMTEELANGTDHTAVSDG